MSGRILHREDVVGRTITRCGIIHEPSPSPDVLDEHVLFLLDNGVTLKINLYESQDLHDASPFNQVATPDADLSAAFAGRTITHVIQDVSFSGGFVVITSGGWAISCDSMFPYPGIAPLWVKTAKLQGEKLLDFWTKSPVTLPHEP